MWRPAYAPPALIGLIVAVVVLAQLGAPGSAAAFSQAYFHTQANGNRGADTMAVQLLLRHSGSRIVADGVFGPATEGSVKTFQAANGLAADGVVGPLTWDKLIVTVRAGSSGEAVRAVQMQLNEKQAAGLEVNGVFDAATRAAVLRYQQHAGIDDDGVVGPTTWKNLVWHYAPVRFGTANLCDYSGGGWSKDSQHDWGTAAAVAQLRTAAAHVGAARTGAVAVGDISREHGESTWHNSHRYGLDVDIAPVRRDRQQCTQRVTWRDPAYDRSATRELVKAIRSAAPNHVYHILFNDPVLVGEGLVTNFDYHDDHLHIKYCQNSRLVDRGYVYTCP